MPVNSPNVVIEYNKTDVSVDSNGNDLLVIDTEKIEVIFTPLGERGPSGSSEAMVWSSNNW